MMKLVMMVLGLQLLSLAETEILVRHISGASFVLRDLILTWQDDSASFSASVENKTDREWARSLFKVIVIGQEREAIFNWQIAEIPLGKSVISPQRLIPDGLPEKFAPTDFRIVLARTEVVPTPAEQLEAKRAELQIKEAEVQRQVERQLEEQEYTKERLAIEAALARRDKEEAANEAARRRAIAKATAVEAAERKRMQSACSAIRMKILDKKMSDLTVAESEAYRLCREGGWLNGKTPASSKPAVTRH